MGSLEENVLAGVYNDPLPVSDPMDADDCYNENYDEGYDEED